MVMARTMGVGPAAAAEGLAAGVALAGASGAVRRATAMVPGSSSIEMTL